VIWASARGCRVIDSEGREYLDLSGGFGVAALGHRNPRVMAAIGEQRVVHALGDLAEAEATVRLRQVLPRPAKLGLSGEDAVEIALRTALLATGKPGIVAFEGAYHGTGLLALAATGLERFRAPFAAWLPGPVYRFPFGDDPGPLPEDAGCVIVEPVQGRAGARVPPDGFLERLRERCDEAGALLIADEIYCGLGRAGEMLVSGELADVFAWARRSAADCRSRPRCSGPTWRAFGTSARRTSTRTRTRARRLPALPRWSCSTRCRGCSLRSCARERSSPGRAGGAPA